MSSETDLVLGIDIGTTSVKVCVVDAKTHELIAIHNKDTQANIPSDQGSDGNKQDVPKIVSVLNTVVAKFPKDLLRRVSRIGICGQMHGVMLWKNRPRAWEKVEREDGSLIRYNVVLDRVSSLYTWQDSRCDASFIASLPEPHSHIATCSGFGTATLLWIARHKPEKLKRFDRSATVHDFVVTMLCDLDEPVMSEQNAASWGYFDCATKQWNKNLLESESFLMGLLPKIVESGKVAGYLAEEWHTIPQGTPIGKIN